MKRKRQEEDDDDDEVGIDPIKIALGGLGVGLEAWDAVKPNLKALYSWPGWLSSPQAHLAWELANREGNSLAYRLHHRWTKTE